jgi:hypothetical protein
MRDLFAGAPLDVALGFSVFVATVYAIVLISQIRKGNSGQRRQDDDK